MRDTTSRIAAPRPIHIVHPAQHKRTFIITSAQSETDIHPQLWQNLLAYRAHIDATLFVGTFCYNRHSMASDGEKVGTRVPKREVWFAPELEDYIRDYRRVLAPDLHWCGELQILPTAENPLVGLEGFTGTNSCIVPHTKFGVVSVATPKSEPTKFMYTTGTVTKRNYIQKKAGQKAEFHHGYGALIVEVLEDETWFVRQLCANDDGSFQDLKYRVDMGVVTGGHEIEAIVWGDIHEQCLEWNEYIMMGRILDELMPKRQVFHDLIDFRSRNHHDRDDSWKQYKLIEDDKDGVHYEFFRATNFLSGINRPGTKSIVVCSNHDMAYERWLKEADFRTDPRNAIELLKGNLRAYNRMDCGDEDWYAVEDMFHSLENWDNMPVRFLRRDESYVVEGIELGVHGDIGANGARGGSLKTFSRGGRKCIIGHSHSAGWFEGAIQVGVMGALDQGYNKGLSSWSHTNALVYPGGKRTLFTINNGKWRS